MIFFRNGYLLWISVVVILVAGLSALTSLPRLEDPRLANNVEIVPLWDEGEVIEESLKTLLQSGGIGAIIAGRIKALCRVGLLCPSERLAE